MYLAAAVRPSLIHLPYVTSQVAVEHYLTVASIYNHYHHVKETAEYVAKAQKALRLDLQMVGE